MNRSINEAFEKGKFLQCLSWTLGSSPQSIHAELNSEFRKLNAFYKAFSNPNHKSLNLDFKKKMFSRIFTHDVLIYLIKILLNLLIYDLINGNDDDYLKAMAVSINFIKFNLNLN